VGITKNTSAALWSRFRQLMMPWTNFAEKTNNGSPHSNGISSQTHSAEPPELTDTSTAHPMSPERQLHLQAKADLATLVMHHWNQVAANVRVAQVKGLGLTTAPKENGEDVADIQHYDANGRLTREFGYASPYTQHGGTSTETHYHYAPPPQQEKNGSSWLWPLLAAAGIGAAAWALWPDDKEPIDNTKDIDVEARMEYEPPK
jgi:hypothetical protein